MASKICMPSCRSYSAKMKENNFDKMGILNNLVIHRGSKFKEVTSQEINESAIPVHPLLLDILTDQEDDDGICEDIMIQFGKTWDVSIVVQIRWNMALHEFAYAIVIIEDGVLATLAFMEIMEKKEEKFHQRADPASCRFLTTIYSRNYFEMKIHQLLK